MALDRQSIEKRDFPIGRRGYEPATVDAHLANVATEVEALQRSRSGPGAPPAPPAAEKAASLASVASTQVQAIVEAAETTAAAIERDAREQATQVEQDAARESQRIRDEAIARSQEHIGQVHAATSLMLQRVDAMESELGALVDSLRTGANRVAADLDLVSTTMSDLYGTAGVPEPGAAQPVAKPDVGTKTPKVVAPEPDLEPEAAAPTGKVEPPAGPKPKSEPDPGDEDIEGARLIALNMALNGQTREETDRYLADNFELSDRAGLLAEVYATVEG